MRPTAGPNPFLDATAWQMLERVAARWPDREAIVAADRRITYAGFVRESERFARALLACGVGKDDKVALWLPNRPAWLFVQQACAMIGAVLVALNTRYKAHELSHILNQSDSTTLVLTDHLGPIDFFETLGEVLPGLRDDEPRSLALAGFPIACDSCVTSAAANSSRSGKSSSAAWRAPSTVPWRRSAAASPPAGRSAAAAAPDIDAVTDPHAVRRLLAALGLAAEPPPGGAAP